MCKFLIVILFVPGASSECGIFSSLDFEDNYPPKDWLRPLATTTRAPMPVIRQCNGLFCGWMEEDQATLPPLQTGVYGPYKEVALTAEKETTGGFFSWLV